MSGDSERTAILTGATGLVGRYLLSDLQRRGFRVQPISRTPPPSTGEPRWRRVDLEQDVQASRSHSPSPELGPAEIAIHAAPLWLLPPWLTTLSSLGVRRIVAFGSTSRVTKQTSADPRERETAARLAEAEDAIAQGCPAQKIRWTILRPTLIHGGGHDQNVADVARWIERFGFFPLVGVGRGLRQPVHVSDLTAACLDVLDNPVTFEQIYDLPGGETLSYREMVTRVAIGVGRRPRLVRTPLVLVRGALAVARRLPRLRHLTAEMASRMNEDLVFDPTPARQDFGYDPGPFRYPDPPERRC